MPSTRNIMPDEVRKAKILLERGLNTAEVASVIERSVSAVIKIRDGAYDFMLPELSGGDHVSSGSDVVLRSIDSKLNDSNETAGKQLDRLISFDTTATELLGELKRCTACMTAILDALNDIKSNLQPLEREDNSKYPGKDFAEWGEVIRRVEGYGDKFIADALRGVRARKDGTVVYLVCPEPSKKFLKCNPVAIPRIKQQCRNVIGYGVEIRTVDQ